MIPALPFRTPNGSRETALFGRPLFLGWLGSGPELSRVRPGLFIRFGSSTGGAELKNTTGDPRLDRDPTGLDR